MPDNTQNEYRPDYVSPPGETLLETLETIAMSQAELAERTGRPAKLINEIVKGKAAITPETALQLERVLGVPARFWNNRERQYRECLAQSEERERLQQQAAWLKRLPLKGMIDLGWIREFDDAVEQLREALNFFGVASPDQWDDLWPGTRVAFRQSAAFQADPGAVAAWLRRGEIEAHELECAAYDPDRFRAALGQLRTLTNEQPEVFQPQMVQLCASAGVAVVFVRELPKVRTSGATRWLISTKALIQLSLRYKSDDQLWFTFFHEAGHILLHGKREIFIEENGAENEKEQAANRFAADLLIPSIEWKRFVRLEYFSREAISSFAARLGIAPGTVVGRLQHEGRLPPSHCNDLKRRLDWGVSEKITMVVSA
jgi:addiction module HigA family antidote